MKRSHLLAFDGVDIGIAVRSFLESTPMEQGVHTGATAVRQQSALNKDMPAQPDPEPQTRAGIIEEHEAQLLRRRWTEIQGDFVDDPRRAVKEADTLVAGAMKRLAEVFANERSELEQQWDPGDNVTTEDLRLALRRYHAFFDRLLSV